MERIILLSRSYSDGLLVFLSVKQKKKKKKLAPSEGKLIAPQMAVSEEEVFHQLIVHFGCVQIDRHNFHTAGHSALCPTSSPFISCCNKWENNTP